MRATEAHPELTLQLLEELEATLHHAEADGVRAILLRAVGPSLCCGSEPEEIARWDEVQLASKIAQVVGIMARLPMPIVA